MHARKSDAICHRWCFDQHADYLWIPLRNRLWYHVSRLL